MERSRYRHRDAADAGRFQRLGKAADVFGGAADDGLPRAVIRGDGDVREALPDWFDLVAAGLNGPHCAAAGCRHQPSALAGEVHQIDVGEDAGCVQRDVLSVTVAGGHIDPKAEALHETGVTRGDCAENRLSDLGAHESSRIIVFRRLVEARWWVEQAIEAEQFEHLAYVFEIERELARGADVLRSLTGEQQRGFAVAGYCWWGWCSAGRRKRDAQFIECRDDCREEVV